MSQQTFKVHFILKGNKTNKKGLAPIFARFMLNSNKIELTTNMSTSNDNWSALIETVLPLTKANKEINQYLENFRGKIYRGYSTMVLTGEGIKAGP